MQYVLCGLEPLYIVLDMSLKVGDNNTVLFSAARCN